MDLEKLVLWHLTLDFGWTKGIAESNPPEGVLVTLKTAIDSINRRGVISSKTYYEHHVFNGDILREAYTRFGALPFYTLE